MKHKVKSFHELVKCVCVCASNLECWPLKGGKTENPQNDPRRKDENQGQT